MEKDTDTTVQKYTENLSTYASYKYPEHIEKKRMDKYEGLEVMRFWFLRVCKYLTTYLLELVHFIRKKIKDNDLNLCCNIHIINTFDPMYLSVLKI